MYATWLSYQRITNPESNKKVLVYTARSNEIVEYWDHVWFNSPAQYQGSRPYKTIAGSYLSNGIIRNDGAFAKMGARLA